MMVLGIALSLYFLLKAQKSMRIEEDFTHGSGRRYFFLSAMVLPISYFTKEPTLVLIPVSLFMLFIFYVKRESPKRKLFLFYFLANCFWGVTAIALSLLCSIKQTRGYAKAYVISLDRIFQNIGKYLGMLYNMYGLLIPLAGIVFLIYLVPRLYQKKPLCFETRWALVMIVGFLGFLFIQSPWQYVLPRYLLPCIFALSIFIGLEVSRFFNFLQGLHKKAEMAAQVALIIAVIWFTVPNLMDTYSYAQWYLAHETLNSNMVALLAKNTPPNGKVYMNLKCPTEWYGETKMHLSLFHNRKDIVVKCLVPQPEENLAPGDLVVTWSRMKAYPENALAKVFKVRMEGVYILKDAREMFYWKIFRVV